MPQFSTQAKDTALNSLDISFLSLHTDYSFIGGNELGDAPYTRLAVTFAPSAFGQRLMQSSLIFTIQSTPVTISWIGMWDANGIFQGMTPNGGDALRPSAMDDIVTGSIKSATHNFGIGDSVVFWSGSSAFLPPELVEGVIYYIVDVNANDYQISDIQAGPPIIFTNSGNGYAQRIYPTSSSGTFQVSSMILDATVIS
jgi:hypothetical protein